MKPPIAIPTSTVARNALVTLAVVAVGAALYWLRDILTPLAMAIFLMIMIDGVKRLIERHTALPDHTAGIAALLLVIAVFFAVIAFIVITGGIVVSRQQYAPRTSTLTRLPLSCGRASSSRSPDAPPPQLRVRLRRLQPLRPACPRSTA